MAKFPQSFGPYTLQELIARGGMAEVYRATMPGVGGFEKTVAIKKILPHLAENAEFVAMLIDEARIIVSLNHANIAQVYDLGLIGETYYIAMEYVHSVDLSGILKELTTAGLYMDYGHVAYIASGICAGLHVAHSAKDVNTGRSLEIVHRDISPHNVLISFAGDVKIIDFGVAKAGGKETNTQMGVIKGKLLYMAPEQAMAKPIDGRADLFAAGLILYKMLTNTLPFDGDNEFQIYNNILSKDIAPPKALNPNVPEALNQITMRLLQRDPAHRFQDGYAAKIELDRAIHTISPGYNVIRLSSWVEDNFTHLLQRIKKKAKPNFNSPQTPPFTGQNTDGAPTVDVASLGNRAPIGNPGPVGFPGPTVEAPAFVPVNHSGPPVPPTRELNGFPEMNIEESTVEVKALDIALLLGQSNNNNTGVTAPMVKPQIPRQNPQPMLQSFGAPEPIPAGFGTGEREAITQPHDAMRAQTNVSENTGQFEIPQTPSRSGRLLPILGILGMLTLIAAMVAYQLFGKPGADAVPVPEVVVPESDVGIPEPEVALAADSGSMEFGENESADSGTQEFAQVDAGEADGGLSSAEIRIEVEPIDAEIYAEGQLVGTSPAVFAVEASEEPLNIEVKHKDFISQTFEVVPSASLTKTIALEPIGEAKPDPPPAKPETGKSKPVKKKPVKKAAKKKADKKASDDDDKIVLFGDSDAKKADKKSDKKADKKPEKEKEKPTEEPDIINPFDL